MDTPEIQNWKTALYVIPAAIAIIGIIVGAFINNKISALQYTEAQKEKIRADENNKFLTEVLKLAVEHKIVEEQKIEKKTKGNV